jgi:hypothetical protein
MPEEINTRPGAIAETNGFAGFKIAKFRGNFRTPLCHDECRPIAEDACPRHPPRGRPADVLRLVPRVARPRFRTIQVGPTDLPTTAQQPDLRDTVRSRSLTYGWSLQGAPTR